jgi:hypothetical protein
MALNAWCNRLTLVPVQTAGAVQVSFYANERKA